MTLLFFSFGTPGFGEAWTQEPCLRHCSAFLQGLGEVGGDASKGGERSPLPCSASRAARRDGHVREENCEVYV